MPVAAAGGLYAAGGPGDHHGLRRQRPVLQGQQAPALPDGGPPGRVHRGPDQKSGPLQKAVQHPAGGLAGPAGPADLRGPRRRGVPV